MWEGELECGAHYVNPSNPIPCTVATVSTPQTVSTRPQPPRALCARALIWDCGANCQLLSKKSVVCGDFCLVCNLKLFTTKMVSRSVVGGGGGGG